MTILEALNWAEAEIKHTLHEKRFDGHSPKLDAQTLLAAAIQKNTSYLITHIDEVLRPETEKQFKAWVQARAKHAPIAYLIGKVKFFGREFFVNEHTLIPRPESEDLIQIILNSVMEDSFVMDIGTGSGALGITLSAECALPVIATDMSTEALVMAEKNAELNHVSQRISFLEGNLLTPFVKTGTNISNQAHGIIVANLPYVPEKDWDFLDPDVRYFEPQTAITAGTDGFDLYAELLEQIAKHRQILPQVLELFFEIDPRQKEIARQFTQRFLPKSQLSFHKDFRGLWRFAHIKHVIY